MGSNFGVLVGPCGAKNQKMVLTNVVQDAILYLKLNYQHMLQKFPYPIIQHLGKPFVSIQESDSKVKTTSLKITIVRLKSKKLQIACIELMNINKTRLKI